jgi:hypothetical protein
MPSKLPSLLDQLGAIAQAANALAIAIRERFPMVGHSWRSADEFRRDPDQTLREVLNWVFKLENRINPGRLPFDHPLRGKVVSKQSLVKITPLRGEFELGLRRIVTAFDDLKRHYRWENLFTTDRERLDFKPLEADEEPTPVAPDILDRLKEGASLVSKALPATVQTGSSKLATAAVEQISPIARAIALLHDHAQRFRKLMKNAELKALMPDTSIATLYRDPQFKAARKAIKDSLRADIPRGRKDAQGNIDAFDEDK